MAFFGVCGWYMGGVFSCFFVFFRKNANFAHLCTPGTPPPPPPRFGRCLIPTGVFRHVILGPPEIPKCAKMCKFAQNLPIFPKNCKNPKIAKNAIFHPKCRFFRSHTNFPTRPHFTSQNILHMGER